MKRFFTVLLMTLGVVFVLQLMAMTYFYVVDPYNLRPILERMMSSSSAGAKTEAVTPGTTQTATEVTEVESEGEATVEAEASTPAVSAQQAEALESAGIAPAALDFTPAEQACFEATLGAARVAEIKAGAVPTMAEFAVASSCVE